MSAAANPPNTDPQPTDDDEARIVPNYNPLLMPVTHETKVPGVTYSIPYGTTKQMNIVTAIEPPSGRDGEFVTMDPIGDGLHFCIRPRRLPIEFKDQGQLLYANLDILFAHTVDEPMIFVRNWINAEYADEENFGPEAEAMLAAQTLPAVQGLTIEKKQVMAFVAMLKHIDGLQDHDFELGWAGSPTIPEHLLLSMQLQILEKHPNPIGQRSCRCLQLNHDSPTRGIVSKPAPSWSS